MSKIYPAVSELWPIKISANHRPPHFLTLPLLPGCMAYFHDVICCIKRGSCFDAVKCDITHARAWRHLARRVTRDVILTSHRSAPKSWAWQILNFENRTIIKGDTAIFVIACKMPWKSYYKMTINLDVWESGWEPHWQGASLNNSSVHPFLNDHLIPLSSKCWKQRIFHGTHSWKDWKILLTVVEIEPTTLGFVQIGSWVQFPLRSIRFYNLSMSVCHEKFFVRINIYHSDDVILQMLKRYHFDIACI